MKGSAAHAPRRSSTNRTNSTSAPSHAIDADTIEVDEFEVNHPSIPNNEHLLFITYDFGGEEYYQATHQFFLSPQSMYILVFDLLRPEEEFSQVSFWLHLINERAPDSPVILVGTHCDDKKCNRAYIEATMRSIFERVKTWDRFPEAYWFSVDTFTGTNMKEFLKTLVEITLQQPNVNVKTPESFLQLENKVMAIKETKPLPPVMLRDILNKLAKESGVPDIDVVAALEYLFSIGVAVYFNDSQHKLDNLVVLGRRWLVDFWVPVMKLRNSESLAHPAVVKPAELKALWKAPKYPADVHQFFLGLLLKFELALPLENGEDLFIPYMLPTSPPDLFLETWKEDPLADEQRRYFCIDGRLPQHIFSRLLCRLIQGVTNWDILTYWRTGILLKQGNQAIVAIQLDVHLSLLKLRVRGLKQVMKLIELDEVIEGFFQESLNLDVVVKIPCRHCLKEGHDQDAYLFAREDLEEAVSRHTNPCVNCMRENRPYQVHVEWLVPDITMTSFSGEKIEFKDLELRKKIGEGANATVYEGRWRNQQVAVKQLNLSSIAGSQNVFADFRREVWLMSGLQNDNLVVLKAITMEPFCMILEFMERGSLYHFLKDPSNAVDWEIRLLFAQDVAHAMNFLHSLVPPIVHRDLKSPNILLTRDENEGRLKAKVSDFGLSRSMTLRGEFDRALKTNNPVWLAPEVMQGRDYNEKADVYSYGVVLWEMLSRSDFFGQYSFMNDIVVAVTSGQRPGVPDAEDPFGVAEDYAALIRSCWTGDPSARPTFSAILQRLEEMQKKLPERPKPRKASSKNIVPAPTSPRGSDVVLSDGDGLDSSETSGDEIDSDAPWSGTDFDSMASSADEADKRVVRPTVARGGYKKGRNISMNVMKPSESNTGLVGKARTRRDSEQARDRVAPLGIVSSSDPDESVDVWQMLNEDPPEQYTSRSSSSAKASKSKGKDKKPPLKVATSSSGGVSERSDLDEEEVDFWQALHTLDPEQKKTQKRKNRAEAEERAIVAVLRRLLRPKKKPRPSSISESDGKPETVIDDEELDLMAALRAIGPSKVPSKAASPRSSASLPTEPEMKRSSATSEEDADLDLISALRATAFTGPTRRLSTRSKLVASKQQEAAAAATSATSTPAQSPPVSVRDSAEDSEPVDFLTALRSIPTEEMPGASAAEKRKAEDRAMLKVIKRYTEEYDHSKRAEKDREEKEQSKPKQIVPAFSSTPPATAPLSTPMQSSPRSKSTALAIPAKPPLTKKPSSEEVDIFSFLQEDPAETLSSSPPQSSSPPVSGRPTSASMSSATSPAPVAKKHSRWGTLRNLLVPGRSKSNSTSAPTTPKGSSKGPESSSSPTPAVAPATPTPPPSVAADVEESEVDFFEALRTLPAPDPVVSPRSGSSKSSRQRSESQKSQKEDKKSSKRKNDPIDSTREDSAGPRVAASAIHIMSDDEDEGEVDFFTALMSTEPSKAQVKKQKQVQKEAAKRQQRSNSRSKDEERSALITVFQGLVKSRIAREKRRETRQPGDEDDEDADSESEPLDFYQALRALDKTSPAPNAASQSSPRSSSGGSVARSNSFLAASGGGGTSGPSPSAKITSSFDVTDDDMDESLDFLAALREIPSLPASLSLSPRSLPLKSMTSDDTDNE